MTFSFHEHLGNQKPLKPKVVDLDVAEYRGTEGWTSVWTLKGGKRLKAIEYGKTYSGLKEVVTAQPLVIGRSYRISVRGQFRIGPGGGALAYFRIDERGEVVVTDPPK